MPDHSSEVAPPARSSLTAKLLLFVALATLGTAAIVSWVAVRGLYAHVSESLERRYPQALARAVLEVETQLAANPALRAPLAPGPRRQLEARLTLDLPDPDSRLLLLDPSGRVLAAAPPGAAPERVDLPLEALLAAKAVSDFADPALGDRVGAARRLNSRPWIVAVDSAFSAAFGPVLRSVTHIFLLDVGLVLAFVFVGYRFTSGMVRPIESLSDSARRIAQGQFDHEIPDPGSRDEIGLLARTVNDMLRRLRRYQAEIETKNRGLTERNAELQQAKETFQQLSITDGLTRLHNHRFFQDHLTREIKRVTRTGEELSMLMIDIDDFKRLNDRFGHAAGDELLMRLARILNETVRESDLLARYGGEEFVILATDTDLTGAYGLAEKVRTSVAETSFILDDSLRPTRVTISVGVARYRGNRKGFFLAADRALYRAKAEGKNCVMMDEEEDIV